MNVAPSLSYILITSLSIGLLATVALLFYLRSERFNDRLTQKEDELLQIADKDNFFEKKKGFIRDDERMFFESLTKAIGDKYYIFPQVHLSDLLKVKDDSRDHENLYQSLGHKSVDYVFFIKEGMIPILALELNGDSHFANNRRNRDKTVESILIKAGINFLALSKDDYLNEATIKRIFSLL